MLVRVTNPTYDQPVSLISLRPGGFALIDPEDYDRLSCHKWFARWCHNRVYAARKIKHGTAEHLIFMHREILQAPNWLKVHHVNQNSLDNRKCNLVAITEREHRHYDGWHIF